MKRRDFLQALIAGAGAASLGLPLQYAIGSPAIPALPVGYIFAKYYEDGIAYVIYDGGSWIPCDGRIVCTKRYADLFAVLGTMYGGGADGFSLPDLRSHYNDSLSTREER